MKARQTLAQQVIANRTIRRQSALGPMPDGFHGRSDVPSYSGALAGPSIIASIFVALSAMLLPGVGGYLDANYALNTAAILFVSYGWLFLVLYVVISIYVMTRLPSALTNRRRDSSRQW